MKQLTDSERLLGALVMDPRMARDIHGRVHADDFADPAQGDVFDGIMKMIARGEHTDSITVANNWPSWGIKSIDVSQIFAWTDTGQVYPLAAREYADSVRNGAIRRAITNQAQSMLERVRNNGEKPIDILTDASRKMTAIIDGGNTGDLQTKLLAQVLEGTDEYDWLIPNLLERRDRLIVTGPEGGGKTTFIRQLSVLSAAGLHPLHFTQIEPVKVLVIDAENTEQQWRRATRDLVDKAAVYGKSDPSKTIHIVAGKRIDLTRGQHLSEIHRLVDIHKPDMLMIGPLYKLVPKAINNDDDAAPLIVALDSLRDRGLALIMEAHAGKSVSLDGQRDLRPRGSAALLGWPEFGFGLARPHGETDVVELQRWRGDRDTNRVWPEQLLRGREWPWVPAQRVDSLARVTF